MWIPATSFLCSGRWQGGQRPVIPQRRHSEQAYKLNMEKNTPCQQHSGPIQVSQSKCDTSRLRVTHQLALGHRGCPAMLPDPKPDPEPTNNCMYIDLLPRRAQLGRTMISSNKSVAAWGCATGNSKLCMRSTRTLCSMLALSSKGSSPV